MEDLYLMFKTGLITIGIIAIVGVFLVFNNEIKKKENIINEIKEYCENNVKYTDRLNDVLEILDKVGDEK